MDDNHVFILKIWQEERDLAAAAAIPRGSLEDVRTRRRVYFASLRELCDVLAERTGMRLPDPPALLPQSRPGRPRQPDASPE